MSSERADIMKFGWEIAAGQISGIFQEIKKSRPLVHMIPNTVSAALCADGLAAMGARPLMAVEAREMMEITKQADVCVVNLGQPYPGKLEAAGIVLQEAAKHKKPLVLDPVGCGASLYRLQSVQKLLSLPWQGIVKGNRSEIYSIQQGCVTGEGIDAVAEHKLSGQIPADRVYLVTGRADTVLWGDQSLQLWHGREIRQYNEEGNGLQQRTNRYNIVGSGCLLGAVAGACYSIVSRRARQAAAGLQEAQYGQRDMPKPAVMAAVAASLGMAFSLEKAAQAPGYGMAKIYLLDAFCRLDGEEFAGWLEQSYPL